MTIRHALPRRPSRARQVRARRPVIGAALGLIGIVHIATTALFYPDSVTSILRGGVIGAVEADPELLPLRGLGFWYATAGLGMVALGAAVADLERGDRLHPRHAAFLGGIGLWGVLLVPKSGFWLFLPLAALAAGRRNADGAKRGTATREETQK